MSEIGAVVCSTGIICLGAAWIARMNNRNSEYTKPMLAAWAMLMAIGGGMMS